MRIWSWTNYRWDEGTAIVENHPNQAEELFYSVQVVSRRLSDFCWMKTNW